LSLERNRSNFRLWKEYAILKCILNSSQSSQVNAKETLKIFNTLLNTSFSSTNVDLNACIDMYGLCVDYALIELDIFYREFDVNTRHSPKEALACLSFREDFWIKNFASKTKLKNLAGLKQTLSEMFANKCLGKGRILYFEFYKKIPIVMVGGVTVGDELKKS
jgi:hypothetical protein